MAEAGARPPSVTPVQGLPSSTVGPGSLLPGIVQPLFSVPVAWLTRSTYFPAYVGSASYKILASKWTTGPAWPPSAASAFRVISVSSGT